jgi:hypothetical protein
MNSDLVHLLTSFAVGTVAAGIAGALINIKLSTTLEVWRSKRSWEERAIAEMLGPIFLQLDRTRRAFDRWDKRNLFLEAEVIRVGNLAIRDLLLSKPHLIPPELHNEASELILHYDVWLEEFDRARAKHTEEKTDPEFVFVGPKGYPFPHHADEKFRSTFHNLWKKIYGTPNQTFKALDTGGDRLNP